MREQVLSARVVPELAGVVLLAIDTERAENEQFLRDYPVAVWPTFYLIDPQSGAVRARWLGAASPAQLSGWLADAQRAQDPVGVLLQEGDAFAAKKNLAEAAARYRAALAAAPADWARRGDVLVSLSSALLKQRSYAECISLGVAEMSSLPVSISAVDFASSTLSCADKASNDPAAVRELRRLAEALLSRACAQIAPGASADDQADACGNLRRAREALGDQAGARRAAEQALAVIDAASAGASQDAQLIYDWERTSSLVYLGRTQEATARLLEREQALPGSYNPPHYLARLYRDTRDWSAGLAAIERALAKAYGPRRIALLGLKAELLKGAGRLAEARAVLEQQLTDYQALPAGQRQPEAETVVQRRLADWSAPAPN